MKKELLVIKELTIEGENGNRLYDLNCIFREGECISLVSAVHQKEVLVEYLRGHGKNLSGNISMKGKQILNSSRVEMEKHKIFIIGSNVPYMESLNIGENIFLLRRNSLRKIMLNEAVMSSQAQYFFDKYHISLAINKEAKDLSALDKIIIGILRCLAQGAKLLVLYDISKTFSIAEADGLLELMKELKKEGVGILISDNHPEYYYRVTDQIIVFEHKKIEKKIYDKEFFYIAQEIVRKECGEQVRTKSRQTEKTNMVISNLYISGQKYQIHIGKNEIVLIDKNMLELEKIWKALTGDGDEKPNYIIEKEQLKYRNMADLAKEKIIFVDPEISMGGIFKNLTEEENILLPSLKKISKIFGFYQKQGKYILQDNFLFENGKTVETIKLQTEGWKIIFYRWKLFRPRLLILYNVFTIVDIRERDFIKKILMNMTERGTAILLLENEMAFCAEFADRIEMMENEIL